MLPPTFDNAGAFWIPACAGVWRLGMTVWPVQTDNRKALYSFSSMVTTSSPLPRRAANCTANRSKTWRNSAAHTVHSKRDNVGTAGLRRNPNSEP